MNKECLDRKSNINEESIKALWSNLYHYPIEWSQYMASSNGPLAEEHRNRIEGFTWLMNGKRDLMEIPKPSHR